MFDSIIDRRPETREKIMKAFSEGKITSIEDLEDQIMAHSLELAIRKRESEGQPDMWIFTIGDEPFALSKSSDRTCQLIMIDKRNMRDIMNPWLSNGFTVNKGKI
jgi:CTP:molybdopterin cytidylyltransferase MocA